MFNNESDRHPVPVQMVLSDGRQVEGNLQLPMTVNLQRVLGSDGAVVEFETQDGVQSLIAKSAIVEIIPVGEAKVTAPAGQATAELSAGEMRDHAPDPYAELGITAAASAEQVQTAYQTKRKEFHPDRYARVGLPDEVLAFIGAKSQQIDAAYKTIASRVAAEVPEAV